MYSRGEHLDLDGFAIVDSLLTKNEIDRLTSLIESLDESSDIRHRRGSAFARRNLLDIDFIRELATSSTLMCVVRPLLREEAKPVRGILFDKTPEANWTVPWHQDLSIAVRERIDMRGFGPWSIKAGVVHVQPPVEILNCMLTVRLAIDDCDETNGPLRVIPGSHRALATPDQIAKASGDPRVVHCCVPRGGAVLMRPMILHASSPATSPAHRRVIHVEYASGELPSGLQWAIS